MTRLEQMRLDRGLTRAELAAQTGVPERTIRELETGNVRKPRLATLVPLAEFFAIAASELLSDFTTAYDERLAA
jgi:transcriptional regulator with XRE-family HTH domain